MVIFKLNPKCYAKIKILLNKKHLDKYGGCTGSCEYCLFNHSKVEACCAIARSIFAFLDYEHDSETIL